MCEITKLCRACLKEKPIKLFYRNRALPSGYDSKCKVCKVQGKKIYRDKTKPMKKRNNAQIFLSAPTSEDWIAAFTFLKNIGYNLTGDKTIHEQFCERHGLKPKRRTREKSIQFTASDFDLI